MSKNNEDLTPATHCFCINSDLHMAKNMVRNIMYHTVEPAVGRMWHTTSVPADYKACHNSSAIFEHLPRFTEQDSVEFIHGSPIVDVLQRS